jgi:hypothetical protein
MTRDPSALLDALIRAATLLAVGVVVVVAVFVLIWWWARG